MYQNHISHENLQNNVFKNQENTMIHHHPTKSKVPPIPELQHGFCYIFKALGNSAILWHLVKIRKESVLLTSFSNLLQNTGAKSIINLQIG